MRNLDENEKLRLFRAACEKFADEEPLASSELEAVRSLANLVPQDLRNEEEALLVRDASRAARRERMVVLTSVLAISVVVLGVLVFFVTRPTAPKTILVVTQASVSPFEDPLRGGAETPRFVDGSFLWLHLEVAREGRVQAAHVDSFGNLALLGPATVVDRGSTTFGPWPVRATGGTEAVFVLSSEPSVSASELESVLESAASISPTDWKSGRQAILNAIGDRSISLIFLPFTTKSES